MAKIHPINCPKIEVKICRAKCNLLSLVMRLVNAMCIVVIQYIEWTGKYSYSTIVMLHNTCTCSYIMINYQAYGIAPTAHVMANGKGNLIHVHV